MDNVRDTQIAATIQDCIASRTPLRILGRGTWLDAGSPVRADTRLSLEFDSGVVAYSPNDLTLVVRAGTSLKEIAEVLDQHNQWLPLDPFNSLDGGDGTIGATVATCSYGPLAALYGTPRDLVLGMTVVTGNGHIISPGGRVVKNVAGFDLTRLMIGSWGTLGVITQVALRVFARTSSSHGLEHMRRRVEAEYGYRAPIFTNPKIARALKTRFDPHLILNPGILGEVA